MCIDKIKRRTWLFTALFSPQGWKIPRATIGGATRAPSNSKGLLWHNRLWKVPLSSNPPSSRIIMFTKNHYRSATTTAFKFRYYLCSTSQELFSLLYFSILGNINTQAPTYCLRWKRDFDTTPTPEDWNMWEALFKLSFNVFALENLFKLTSR